MVSNKSWDAIDPKDAKMLALVTKVNESQANQDAKKQEDHDVAFTKGNNNLEVWRKVKGEPKVTKNGKEFWWFPRHK